MDDWTKLIDHIPTYEDESGGISMNALAKAMNMQPRDLRRLIAAARQSGKIICSTSCGYYIPTTIPQIRAHARYMLSRIESSWESLAPVLHVMRRWDKEGYQTKDIIERIVNLYNLIAHELPMSSEYDTAEE